MKAKWCLGRRALNRATPLNLSLKKMTNCIYAGCFTTTMTKYSIWAMMRNHHDFICNVINVMNVIDATTDVC